MDNANYPIWEEPSTEWVAELWKSHFARKAIYNAYNSWYLSEGMPRSQEVKFEAYDLSTWEKLRSFFHFKRQHAAPHAQTAALIRKVNEERYAETLKAETSVAKKSMADILPLGHKLS
jgi:hypothetical protein